MREVFQRLEDGSLVTVEVDLNAFRYSNVYTWLFSVFIKFDGSNEQADGYEEFLETKESLIITLEHDEKAKYVGSRVVDGWTELYFYVKDSKSLEYVVTQALKSSNYVYESNGVKDTKWDFHYKHLMPSELELSHIESEKIISELEDEGDDLTLERDVEHYISFELPTQKNRFVNTFNLEGFSIKDEIDSEEFENGLALVKVHNVSRETLKEEVSKLFSEIKKCQGFYEGWSTTLANETDV